MSGFEGDEPNDLPEIVHIGKRVLHWNPDVILTYKSGSTSSPNRSFVLCKILHVHAVLRFRLDPIRLFRARWKHCHQNSSERETYHINNQIKKRPRIHCHPL